MESVPDQTPVHNFSDAWGVSDTSAVVGTSRNSSVFETGHAVFWLGPGSPTVLQQWLDDTYGLVIPNWILRAAYDISADGRMITGYGINPAGLREAWKVELPTSLAGSFFVPIPLAIGVDGAGLELSWPTGAAVVIESLTDLGAEWGTLDLPSQTVNGREVISVPLEGSARFFRLRQVE